ncbi:universal stress protein [Rufibacter psychrotolerans]|uniref:universal stress protein n=1 Tax=Rufibacter psychrotolerans TaxID=2812556 RepID=UPI0019681075|nr:universal stress protein [Rufibacter sp. SYSU D00308]
MLTILCPTNFSASSENAIRYADEIAQRINSNIILFHNIAEPVAAALVPAGGSLDAPAPEELCQEKKKLSKLKRIKAALETTEWGIPVSYETKLGHGETHRAITNLALEEKADLVVLAASSKQGMKEIVTQSLTGHVVRQAACPVLMIPNKTSFKPIRRMVLATDLRGFCVSDMTLVLKLASYFGAQLQLVHVLPTEDETARQFAMEELQRLSKRISYQRLSLHVEVNACTMKGISQFCQNQRADMLVMGTHTVNAWEPLFQTEQEQTHFANLPLLMIHAKKIQF